jgi:hypothetical protein
MSALHVTPFPLFREARRADVLGVSEQREYVLSPAAAAVVGCLLNLRLCTVVVLVVPVDGRH